MSSLSFPDINVWLALSAAEHVHRNIAEHWWSETRDLIAFCRFTQIGFLRLTTTAAAMSGKPLTLAEAWDVYDAFFADERVVFRAEPALIDGAFRSRSSRHSPSPKVLADAWLLAFAEQGGGRLVTFDRALGAAGAVCLL